MIPSLNVFAFYFDGNRQTCVALSGMDSLLAKAEMSLF